MTRWKCAPTAPQRLPRRGFVLTTQVARPSESVCPAPLQYQRIWTPGQARLNRAKKQAERE